MNTLLEPPSRFLALAAPLRPHRSTSPPCTVSVRCLFAFSVLGLPLTPTLRACVGASVTTWPVVFRFKQEVY